MPNAPSNWMSFADYLGVAGPAAQRTLEQEQQRVNDLGGQTNAALQTAGQQAVAGRGTDLNQTAGYSDFLKAQQAQRTAYQQLQAHASGAGQGSAQESALYGAVGQGMPAQNGGDTALGEAGWQQRAATRQSDVAASDAGVAKAKDAAQAAQDARDAQYQEALGRMLWDATAARGDLTTANSRRDDGRGNSIDRDPNVQNRNTAPNAALDEGAYVRPGTQRQTFSGRVLNTPYAQAMYKKWLLSNQGMSAQQQYGATHNAQTGALTPVNEHRPTTLNPYAPKTDPNGPGRELTNFFGG